MQEYLKLLEDLIRLRPVTKNVQAVNQAADLVQKFLAARGLHCAMEELDGRKILYASNVPGKTPDLLLNAHIDVVPAAYESQYEPDYRDDGWLYARGKEYELANGKIGPLTQHLYDTLTGIQWGRIPDEFGWIVPID